MEVLKKIWKLADRDADNKLTGKEFCVAFHLIVCVGKQGLEVPPVLPPSFQAFLDNAPDAPTFMPQSGTSPSHQGEGNGEGSGKRTPSSQISPSQGGRMSPKNIPGKANTIPLGGSRSSLGKATPSPGVSSKDVEAVKTAVEGVTEASKEVSGVREGASSTSMSIYDSFKDLVHKLSSEKETLVTEIQDTKKDITDSATQLQTLNEEIKELYTKCSCLRSELNAALSEKSSNNEELAKSQGERRHLLKQIETIRDQMNHTQASINTITPRVGREEGALGEQTAERQALTEQATSLSKAAEEGKKEIAHLRKLLLDMTNDKLKLAGVFDGLQRRLTSLQQSKTAESGYVEEAKARVSSLERETESLTAEKREVTQQLAVTKEEISALAAKCEELLLQKEAALEARDEASQSLRGAQREVESHKIILQQGDADRQALEARIRILEEERVSHRSAAEQGDASRQALESKIRALEEGKHQMDTQVACLSSVDDAAIAQPYVCLY